MSGSVASSGNDTKRFACEQAQILVEHLVGEQVDYTFVARHAATILQLAESELDFGGPEDHRL